MVGRAKCLAFDVRQKKDTVRSITPEILSESITLIRAMRSSTLDVAALSEVYLRLRQLLPDPEFLGYTVNLVPELSPEEVVRRAFEYRPIILGAAAR